MKQISAIAFFLFSSLLLTFQTAFGQAGVLDSSFSDDGILLVSVPNANSTTGTGIELQADGKYLVSGKAGSQMPVSFSNFLVVQVNTDGSIDSSFGTDGYSVHNTYGRSFAHDLGLQQDEKILVTGQDFDNVSVTEDIGVMRLNTDGSPDLTFGDSGRVDIDHGHTEEGHTIIQLADGKMVLTGHTDFDLPTGTIDGEARNNIFIARLLANGSNDSTFGTGGFTTFDFGGTQDYSKNMILQADKYIAGSCTCLNGNCHAVMIRVNPDGTLDPAFGNDGVAAGPTGVESVFWRMTTQADGKIVAAGQVIYSQPAYDLFVQRFTADGQLDSTFAANGTYSLDLGQPAEKFEDVLIQPDGKIVCAGYSSEGTGNGDVGDAVVVRLNPDGTPDYSFGDSGIFVLSMVSGFDETKACMLDQEGKIVVTGYAHNMDDGGGNMFVFRLHAGCAASYQISASGPTTFCKGESVSLTVTPPADSYQWYKNGNPINGATNASYTATVKADYSCSVNGECGSFTTGAVFVNVNPKPKAVVKPGGTVTMCLGDSLLLKANNSVNLSYQWYKNNNTIAGATQSSYWAKQEGSYRVQTTAASGCVSKSGTTTVEITCKDLAATADSILIYPNPSNGKITVQWMPQSDGPMQSNVFDLTGRLIATVTTATAERTTILDFQSLSPGVYFLEMKTSSETIRRQFSIVR